MTFWVVMCLQEKWLDLTFVYQLSMHLLRPYIRKLDYFRVFTAFRFSKHDRLTLFFPIATASVTVGRAPGKILISDVGQNCTRHCGTRSLFYPTP